MSVSYAFCVEEAGVLACRASGREAPALHAISREELLLPRGGLEAHVPTNVALDILSAFLCSKDVLR